MIRECGVEVWEMFRYLQLGICVGALTACVPEEPDQLEPTFDSISAKVFEVSCIDSGCHSASSAAGNLVLEGPDVYDSLLNEPCDNPLAIVEGLRRVTPGNEMASLLYLKITDPVGMGQPMPPSVSLDDTTIEIIAEWIRSSAEE